MDRLMFAYNYLEDTPKVLKLGEKLMPLCIETPGEGDLITGHVRFMCSRSHRGTGRLEQAVKSREWRERRQDPDDTDLLWSEYELAMDYIETGRYFEAVHNLQLVVKKQKTVITDSHKYTLISQVELARAYDGLGQPGTGIPLLVNAIGLGE